MMEPASGQHGRWQHSFARRAAGGGVETGTDADV